MMIGILWHANYAEDVERQYAMETAGVADPDKNGRFSFCRQTAAVLMSLLWIALQAIPGSYRYTSLHYRLLAENDLRNAPVQQAWFDACFHIFSPSPPKLSADHANCRITNNQVTMSRSTRIL